MFVERNIESFRQRTREHAIRAFHYVCRVTRLPIKGKGRRKERFPCRRVVFLDILPEISNDPPRTRNIAFLFDFSLPRNEIANVLLSHIYIYIYIAFFQFLFSANDERSLEFVSIDDPSFGKKRK